MTGPPDDAPAHLAGPVAGPENGAGTGGPRLVRNLGLPRLIGYGLLFIGPAAPFSVFGVLDARANGAVAAVYLVATLAMGLTALSYARMAGPVPRAGSVSAYAHAGLGRVAGFLAGWMVALDYLLIPSLGALFTGIATHALAPGIPVWTTTAAALVVITAINLTSTRVAAAVGLAVLGVEVVMVAAFLVLAVVVLATEGPARPWLSPLTSVGVWDPAAVLTAASVAVLSFLGFDAIASFAEENTGRPALIGRATLICLVLAGLLFVAQTYLGALLTRVTPEQLAADPATQGTAFYTTIREAISGWFGTAVTAIKAVGPVFSAMVAQAAASRLLYGMARQGLLPAVLGRVDARTRTPVVAIAVCAVATAAVAILAALRPDGLELLSSLVTVGALVAFGLLHASVIGFFVLRRGSRAWWAHLVLPAAGGLVVLAVLISASRPALLLGAAWLAVGVVVLLVRGRRPGAAGGPEPDQDGVAESR